MKNLIKNIDKNDLIVILVVFIVGCLCGRFIKPTSDSEVYTPSYDTTRINLLKAERVELLRRLQHAESTLQTLKNIDSIETEKINVKYNIVYENISKFSDSTRFSVPNSTYMLISRNKQIKLERN